MVKKTQWEVDEVKSCIDTHIVYVKRAWYRNKRHVMNQRRLLTLDEFNKSDWWLS